MKRRGFALATAVACLLFAGGCGSFGEAPAVELAGPVGVKVQPTPAPLPEADLPSHEVDAVDTTLPFRPQDIENECFLVAEGLGEILGSVPHYQSMGYRSYRPSPEQMQAIVDSIGGMGFPATGVGIDMTDFERVYEFYDAVQAGADDELGIYVFTDRLTRLCFASVGGQVSFSSAGIEWREDGSISYIPMESVRELEVFELTGKGYLFYGQNGDPSQNRTYKYGIRVAPLGDDLREMTRTYLDPLSSYAGHNILTQDWNRESLSKLSYNDVFEMLYYYETGRSTQEAFESPYDYDRAYIKAVPAPVFESLITRYFPVTAEELRRYAQYNPDKDAYAVDPLLGGFISPDWEVVDYVQREDGSISIMVDAVSTRYGSDQVATHVVTVMPHEDGTFQYLSNEFLFQVENAGKSYIFPVYQPRIFGSGE